MKKYVKYIIIIFCLIVIDQGAKLIVAHFYKDDIVLASNNIHGTELMRTFNTLHIHPMINDSDRQELLQKSLDNSINIKTLIYMDVALNTIFIVVFNLFIYGFLSFVSSQNKFKKHPKLLSSILCLNMSAGICSGIIDQIFWGSSLDFICISWGSKEWAGDHYHLVPNHQIFDLKDIYLWIGGTLLILRSIHFMIDYIKLNKDEKKEFEQKLKNYIKSIFYLKNNNKQV